MNQETSRTSSRQQEPSLQADDSKGIITMNESGRTLDKETALHHDFNETPRHEHFKSTWLQAREEFGSRRTTKAVLFLLLTLFLMTSMILSAVALMHEGKQRAEISLSAATNKSFSRSVPTMSPSTTNFRTTELTPTTAPWKSAQLFDPTLCAALTDPNGCPRHPTPLPLPGKKGIAFTLRPVGQKGSWVENLQKVQAAAAYWNYNWGSNRIEAQPVAMEFTPMIWGRTKVPEFINNNVMPQLEKNQANRLLGFNEPDRTSQANMTVDQAIELWPLLEETGLSLVSPSCADPMGTWMDEFITRTAELCFRVDWIGVHWYGGPNASSFQTKMQAIFETYGKPVLITEFAPADWTATTVQNNKHSPAAVLEFARQVLPWLEEQPWIVGYAWFSFDIDRPEGTSSALFDLDGVLTPLGQYYASVRT